MAATITQSEFKDALSRYPAVIKALNKPKEGQASLEELDHFRYQTAPASFSKKTGRVMELGDIKKLVDWKVHHGTYRPTLAKLVNSNTDEKVAAACKEAFEYYAANPTDLANTITKLAAPLKGIGPATASLLLSIHDPENILFFSDELYRYLLFAGKKVTPKYTVKEFESLFAAQQKFQGRIKCTPQELEQVAFVIIKENEPVYEPKPKKVPSGLPRGRPPKPDSEKKARKVAVPGRGRGRPPKNGVAATPKKAVVNKEVDIPASGEKKKRGRPTNASLAAVSAASTPASKKRKASETPASDAKRGAKKVKA